MRALLLSIFSAVLGYIALSYMGLPHLQALLVAVIILLVILWTNEALPLGVVSLLPIILFPVFGIGTVNAVTANYAKPIIFLFLGGFMLAVAVEKTGLHRTIATRVLKIFPQTVRGIIAGLTVTSALLSGILSNTTTALLLLPIALILSQDTKIKLRLVLAIAYGSSVGGILTPIGTPPNLILLQYLREHDLVALSFMQWMLYMLPLVGIMLTVVTFVLAKGYGKQPLQMPPADPQRTDRSGQRKLLIILGLLMIMLFINAPLGPWPGLGWDENLLLLGAGLSAFFPRINLLTWADNKKIPYEIIFLFGAGFSLAAAFSGTGLADAVASALAAWDQIPFPIMLLMVATLVTFATEITSNTALVSIMLPVIYAVATALGLNAMLLLTVCTICASYAFMLPIATPPNAIAVSSGVVSTRQMMFFGFVLNLFGIGSITMVALFLWQWLL